MPALITWPVVYHAGEPAAGTDEGARTAMVCAHADSAPDVNSNNLWVRPACSIEEPEETRRVMPLETSGETQVLIAPQPYEAVNVSEQAVEAAGQDAFQDRQLNL